MPPQQQREQLVAYAADVILVSQAADAKKFENDPDFKRHLAFMRNKLLMGMQLQEAAKSAVNDEAEHALYESSVKPMGNEEEVHARHILVDSEDEAKAIVEQPQGRRRLRRGGEGEVEGPGVPLRDGGDLGYFTKDQMVPEFAEVAFKMYPGQLSNPIKTQFGWHIIKVEDRRQRQVPDFDKVKDQIDAYLVRQAQSQYIAGLRKTAKVERLDHPADPSLPPLTLPISPEGGAPEGDKADK